MGSCAVNSCCFCVEIAMGVRIIAVSLLVIDILAIAISFELFSQFTFFAIPFLAFGILSHVIAFSVATFGLGKELVRWFLIPWLIYLMIDFVALLLGAFLQVSVALKANLGIAIGIVIICLAAASLYMYFFLIGLQLFIQMAPFVYYDGVIYAQAPFPNPINPQFSMPDYQYHQPLQQQQSCHQEFQPCAQQPQVMLHHNQAQIYN